MGLEGVVIFFLELCCGGSGGSGDFFSGFCTLILPSLGFKLKMWRPTRPVPGGRGPGGLIRSSVAKIAVLSIAVSYTHLTLPTKA